MPQPPVTRSTLLIRLRDPRDAQAWEEFLDLYAPVVHGFYRRRGLQEADAADLTQEVMSAVAARAENFDYDAAKGKFRAWLYTIARNKFSDFLHRRGREQQGRGDTATLQRIAEIPAGDDSDWEWEYRQRLFALAAERVRSCVDPSTWTAFWRTAVEGESGSKTAEELCLSVGAVYVAKSRVLARLKREVASIEGDQ